MHADLHSRNFQVRKIIEMGKIIIYDFGLCFSSVSADKNEAVGSY